jgi:hypothetical protein
MVWIEITGYIASALIAVSLMMSKIIKLRLINMAGAVTFVVYGLIVGAYPVFAVNLLIIFINIYYLFKIFKSKDYFTVLHIEDNNSAFLRKFINYHNKDITKFFPEFNIENIVDTRILLILRNMIPVGVFISKPKQDECLDILIDYIIPDYRDFKNAIFLLHSEEMKKYKDEGFGTLSACTKNGMHRKYLLKMGYIQDPNNESMFTRKI